jgi:N-acetylated-alpha-linked acidic dipeptidase
LSTAPLKKLEAAIDSFLASATAFDAKAAHLASQLSPKSSTLSSAKKEKLWEKISALNKNYKLLERQFLYAPGLDSRTWFKHVVFAPGLWTGYAGATFPGLVEAFDDKDEEAVKKWTKIIVGTVDAAAELLES